MFLRASNKLFLRLADKSVKALNTGSASKLLRWSSSEPIQPKQPDSQEELQYELDKQFLQYQQKLNMIRREACSYTPKAAEIEEFPHPFFIGKVGVRLSDIKFYRLKSEPLEAAQASGNKSVNYPKASWMRLLFPLESKPEMRDGLANLSKTGIRIGRLLELMDMMAGRVAYTHCFSTLEVKPMTIVTASADGIEFFPNKIDMLKDFYADSYITYAGTSSMEVRIDVCNDEGKMFCSAYYLMVARDNKTGGSYAVPKLAFDFEDDKATAALRFQLAKMRQENRIAASKNSLEKLPPLNDEVEVLHKFFVNNTILKKEHKLVPLESTKVVKTILKHHQDRNIHGKIFGGLLMRESMELAFVCAKLQGSGKSPIFTHIDDIHFIRPVEIGSTIRYSAWMTYCRNRIANVKVIVERLDKQGDTLTSQTAFSFNVVLFLDRNLEGILPETYEDAMLYLEGRRRVNKLFNDK